MQHDDLELTVKPLAERIARFFGVIVLITRGYAPSDAERVVGEAWRVSR